MEYIDNRRTSYQDIKRKRLSADFLDHLWIYVIAIAAVIFFILAFRHVVASDYEYELVSYTMEKGDSITIAIETVNNQYEGPYDVRDLISIVVSENELDSHVVLVGETYLIPKLTSSH